MIFVNFSYLTFYKFLVEFQHGILKFVAAVGIDIYFVVGVNNKWGFLKMCILKRKLFSAF